MNISYTLFIGIRQVGPHGEAIHVSFGDDGEATGLEVKPAELADLNIYAYLQFVLTALSKSVYPRASATSRATNHGWPSASAGRGG